MPIQVEQRGSRETFEHRSDGLPRCIQNGSLAGRSFCDNEYWRRALKTLKVELYTSVESHHVMRNSRVVDEFSPAKVTTGRWSFI